MEVFVVPRATWRRLRESPSLARLAGLVRIDTLAAIRAARHGWVGASFSAVEILVAIYFGLGQRNVVLSKGHAAAAQYACLRGLGFLRAADLRAYKDGPAAPQAHPSRGTPGILVETGSLGQALSRVAGMAAITPEERFFVILGDGELQEGQVHEAFQTVCHRGLTNLVVVIDCNGFQTERRVDSVKRIADMGGLLEAYGFHVLRLDGQDPEALSAAMTAAPRQAPLCILAHTRKGAGHSAFSPRGELQPWHGKVPDRRLYLDVVADLVEQVRDPTLRGAFQRYRASLAVSLASPDFKGVAASPSQGSSSMSTRDAYSLALPSIMDRHPQVVVLDADLSAPCGLAAVGDPGSAYAGAQRFFQMGISEQDMASFGGGLALRGRLPLLNTYAAFWKRAVEQVHANLSEGLRVIYVGHYAGLCYYTDGRSHQSYNDLGIFGSFPDLVLVEPTIPAQVEPLLSWLLAGTRGSAYLRLRRSPHPQAMLRPATQRPWLPLQHRPGARRCLVVMGPASLRVALDALETPALASWGLVAVPVLHHPLATAALDQALAGREIVLTIEEDLPPGVLRSAVLDSAARGIHEARVLSIHPRPWGASFRTLDACLDFHGFTVRAVLGLAQE